MNYNRRVGVSDKIKHEIAQRLPTVIAMTLIETDTITDMTVDEIRHLTSTLLVEIMTIINNYAVVTVDARPTSETKLAERGRMDGLADRQAILS
jgi:hypothetical protein